MTIIAKIFNCTSKLASSKFIFDLLPTWFQLHVVMSCLRIYESSFYATSPWLLRFLWPWDAIPLFTAPRLTLRLERHLHLMIYCLFLCPVHWPFHRNTSDQCWPCGPMQIILAFSSNLCWLCAHAWRLLGCLFLSCLSAPPRSPPILNDNDMKLSPQTNHLK